MRRIDLHCYPGTQEWVSSQGPYVEALGKYWGKEWVGKSEEDVVADVKAAGMEAVLVAFDIEAVTGAPPCTNAYVAALRDRHPETFIGAWGAVISQRYASIVIGTGLSKRGGRAIVVMRYHFTHLVDCRDPSPRDH